MDNVPHAKKDYETFLEKPLFLPTVFYLSAIFLIRPWGNYPTNDDWIYAHIVKQFVEQGTIPANISHEVTLLAQVLIAAPFVKAFGFSHILLRGLTLFVGWLGLGALHKLMDLAGVKKQIQIFSLTLVVFNPLFLNLAASFMTEIYCYVLALWTAVLWFSERKKQIRSAERGNDAASLISWKIAIITGILCGGVYWIRQTGILIFPALLAASLLDPLLKKNGRRLAASLPRLAASALLLGLIVGAYSLFIKNAGNDTAEVSRVFHSTMTFNADNWLKHVKVFFVYMAFFSYPLFFLFWLKELNRHQPPIPTIILVCACAGLLWIAWTPSHESNLIPTVSLKYFENIIHAGGVGPIQLNDYFQLRQYLRPAWSHKTLEIIRGAILFVTISWIPFLASLSKVWKTKGDALTWEIYGFGGLFSLASFLQIIQSYQQSKEFDRYLFPVFLGFLIVTAVTLSRASGEASPHLGPRPKFLFALLLLPLAYYSVAGVHDYFRWEDARWDLFNKALASGISPKDIEGGYEVSGWRDAEITRDPAPSFIYDWNDPHPEVHYRIAMNILDGCKTVKTENVSYWLTQGPPVLLTRRS